MSVPPPVVISEDIENLRADLAALGSLSEVLGPLAAAALAREQRVPALLVARESAAPQAAVLRLFMLGDGVPASSVAAALPTVGVAGLARLGLVRLAGSEGLVRAAVDLTPVGADQERLWLASDLGERVTGRALAADHVLGVGGAGLTLAGITERRPVGRALDLGTGCGIQAALLHGHAQVTVTDISERALAFARFNAALNGQVWEVRRGSMFAPVAGERFDLIVSNPPFVITPAAAYEAGLPVMEYRDIGRLGGGRASGAPGLEEGAGPVRAPSPADRVLAGLLNQLGSHLSPGGQARILGNWECGAGWDWKELLGEAAQGLDLWVIQREEVDPAQYVELWLRDGGIRAGEGGRREAVYAAWLADFQMRGVESIGFGYILAALAPPGRAPVRRFEAVEGAAMQPLGAHLAAAFSAQRRHADEGGGALGRVPHWRLVAGADITVEHHYLPGAPEPAVIRLRQGGGFGRSYQMSTALAGLISVADGTLTVGQTAAALAELLDLPVASVLAELCGDVVELVATGFLERVD